MGPPLCRVVNTRGIMPLSIKMGHAATQLARAILKQPIAVGMRAVQNDFGRTAPLFKPFLAGLAQVSSPHSPRGNNGLVGRPRKARGNPQRFSASALHVAVALLK